MPPIQHIDMAGIGSITRFDPTVDSSTAQFMQMLKVDVDLIDVKPPLIRIVEIIVNNIDESQRPSVAVEEGLVSLRYPLGVKSEIASRHSSDIVAELAIVLHRKVNHRSSGPAIAISASPHNHRLEG